MVLSSYPKSCIYFTRKNIQHGIIMILVQVYAAMLSAVILQFKQQHEINKAEWNEKVENNWLAIDGVLNISLNFAISRASKLEFIGVFREINAYKVMVLSGTTHVIRGILIIHAAQRYWKKKTKQMKINQTRTMLIPEILPLRTNLFVMSSRMVQNRYHHFLHISL